MIAANHTPGGKYEQREKGAAYLPRAFRKAYEDLLYRKLVCTPYQGAYGIAGWVLCLEGSPPRGTIVIADNHYPASCYPCPVFYIGEGKCRRLGGKKDLDIVLDFWRLHLRETETAFTVQAVKPNLTGETS